MQNQSTGKPTGFLCFARISFLAADTTLCRRSPARCAAAKQTDQTSLACRGDGVACSRAHSKERLSLKYISSFLFLFLKMTPAPFHPNKRARPSVAADVGYAKPLPAANGVVMRRPRKRSGLSIIRAPGSKADVRAKCGERRLSSANALWFQAAPRCMNS